MPLNVNAQGRILSVQKIMVGGVESTPSGERIDGKDVMLNSLRFGGDVYESEHTMTDDLPYRFSSTSLKLRGAVILISTYDVLIGDISNQRYPKSAGSSLTVDKLDISTLYFKNAIAGNNTKINIIGVRL